jgi:thiamine pyrophosphokinase
MATTTAVVFAGGEPVSAHLAERLPGTDLVVAADSGVEHALALGWRVDVVVGDLDSAAPAALDAAIAAGAQVERHPVDKDQTDLELALRAARARGAGRVVVVGGHGGRLDHLLANALVLASPAADGADVEWLAGTARVTVVRSEAGLTGSAGSTCSLLAVGGPARGVRTEGLRFALRGDDLMPGSTRGMSNELTGTDARVSVEAGTLLAVQPESTR